MPVDNPFSLPDQTGKSGKVLGTDGTNPSWGTVAGTLPSQTGNSGKYLTTDGSNASWSAIKPWILLETLSPSAVSTITSSALSSYKFYRVEFEVNGFTNGTTFYVRLAGNSTNNQPTFQVKSGAATANSTDNALRIYQAVVSATDYDGAIEFTGDTVSTGISAIFRVNYDGNTTLSLGGKVPGVSTMVSQTITFFPAAGTFSGTIRIYGHA